MMVEPDSDRVVFVERPRFSIAYVEAYLGILVGIACIYRGCTNIKEHMRGLPGSDLLGGGICLLLACAFLSVCPFRCPLIAQVIVTRDRISRVPYEGANFLLKLLSLPKRFSWKRRHEAYFGFDLHVLNNVVRHYEVRNSTNAIIVRDDDERFLLKNMPQEFFDLLEPSAKAVG